MPEHASMDDSVGWPLVRDAGKVKGVDNSGRTRHCGIGAGRKDGNYEAWLDNRHGLGPGSPPCFGGDMRSKYRLLGWRHVVLSGVIRGIKRELHGFQLRRSEPWHAITKTQ
jgi:hypothetical protein